MKKFTIKGVLDGFRSSVAQQVKPDQEIIENLRSEHFQAKKVSFMGIYGGFGGWFHGGIFTSLLAAESTWNVLVRRIRRERFCGSWALC